jgi:hypothetical protein
VAACLKTSYKNSVICEDGRNFFDCLAMSVKMIDDNDNSDDDDDDDNMMMMMMMMMMMVMMIR